MLTESAEIMVVELLRFMAQVLNLHGLIIICMAPNAKLGLVTAPEGYFILILCWL